MPKGVYERKRVICNMCGEEVANTVLSRHRKRHERTEGLDYWTYHWRVRKERGTPNHCEHCGITDPNIKYEWASVSKDYANVMDYIRLCKPCHNIQDGRGKRNWRDNPTDTSPEARSERAFRAAKTRERNGTHRNGGRRLGEKHPPDCNHCVMMRKRYKK